MAIYKDKNSKPFYDPNKSLREQQNSYIRFIQFSLPSFCQNHGFSQLTFKLNLRSRAEQVTGQIFELDSRETVLLN